MHTFYVSIRCIGLCALAAKDGSSIQRYHCIIGVAGAVGFHRNSRKGSQVCCAYQVTADNDKGSAGLVNILLYNFLQNALELCGLSITVAIVQIHFLAVQRHNHMAKGTAFTPCIRHDLSQIDIFEDLNRLMTQQQVAKNTAIAHIKGRYEMIMLVAGSLRNCGRRCVGILITDMKHRHKICILLLDILNNQLECILVSAPAVGCPVDDAVLLAIHNRFFGFLRLFRGDHLTGGNLQTDDIHGLHINAVGLSTDRFFGSHSNGISGDQHIVRRAGAGGSAIVFDLTAGKGGNVRNSHHIAAGNNKGSSGFRRNALNEVLQHIGLFHRLAVTVSVIDIDRLTFDGQKHMAHGTTLAPGIGSIVRENEGSLFLDGIMAQQQVAEFITVGQLNGSHPVVVLIASLFRNLRGSSAYIVVANMEHRHHGHILLTKIFNNDVIVCLASAPAVGNPVDNGGSRLHIQVNHIHMLHINRISLSYNGLSGCDGNSGSGHHNSGISAGSGSMILHLSAGKGSYIGHTLHIANSDNKGSAGFCGNRLDHILQRLRLACGCVITKTMVNIDLPAVNGCDHMAHGTTLAPGIGSVVRKNNGCLFLDGIMAQQQVAEFITVGQLNGSHPVIVLITSLFRNLRRRCAHIIVADMVHGNNGSILLTQLINNGIVSALTSAPAVSCPVDDGVPDGRSGRSRCRVAGEGGVHGDQRIHIGAARNSVDAGLSTVGQGNLAAGVDILTVMVSNGPNHSIVTQSGLHSGQVVLGNTDDEPDIVFRLKDLCQLIPAGGILHLGEVDIHVLIFNSDHNMAGCTTLIGGIGSGAFMIDQVLVRLDGETAEDQVAVGTIVGNRQIGTGVLIPCGSVVIVGIVQGLDNSFHNICAVSLLIADAVEHQNIGIHIQQQIFRGIDVLIDIIAEAAHAQGGDAHFSIIILALEGAQLSLDNLILRIIEGQLQSLHVLVTDQVQFNCAGVLYQLAVVKGAVGIIVVIGVGNQLLLFGSFAFQQDSLIIGPCQFLKAYVMGSVKDHTITIAGTQSRSPTGVPNSHIRSNQRVELGSNITQSVVRSLDKVKVQNLAEQRNHGNLYCFLGSIGQQKHILTAQIHLKNQGHVIVVIHIHREQVDGTRMVNSNLSITDVHLLAHVGLNDLGLGTVIEVFQIGGNGKTGIRVPILQAGAAAGVVVGIVVLAPHIGVGIVGEYDLLDGDILGIVSARQSSECGVMITMVMRQEPCRYNDLTVRTLI